MKQIEEKIAVSRQRRLFWLSWTSKFVGAFLFLAVFFYVVTGSLFDRGFLKRDLQEKYGQVAGATTTALTVRFIGPPEEPVLTATPLCQNYAPFINLSWTSDDQTDYFNISRDGIPLISGVVSNSFADSTVVTLTGYTYTVTAFNNAGQTSSNLVNATSLDCGTQPIPDPICEITKFDAIDLTGFVGTPYTANLNPIFYGISNIPNATVEVLVAGGTSVFAITSANINGYWDWSPLGRLNYGEHTIWVTVIDPSDSARRMTDSLKFEIIKEEEVDHEEGGEEDKINKHVRKETVSTHVIQTIPQKPVPTQPERSSTLNLSVAVRNPEKVGYPGKKLSAETKIDLAGGTISQMRVLRYWIIDENHKKVFQDSDEVFVKDDLIIKKNLIIPRLLKSGKYKLLVDIEYDGTIITAEDDFILKEAPLINLGGGIAITAYQIMDNLLWVILWLLILLLIFLILLSIEHWISQGAIIQITENVLNKNGFIIRKK
jgi:hypothetical protein